ncbi:ATP-dependent helicase [Kocuria sp. LUK]|uniref:ATP-dependent helicase n=1 Tax=Kocuria sp. LUK TaxID=2897828 RepID=UPI001E2CFF72|nr:ATP-dependent helicase [Kocuria sp. LUK]MCD1145758.1 ATP-dependent helicase [Kocuria sp. LUK]
MSEARPGGAPELPLEERILEGLDPEQREVAMTLRGPVCVLAGAGTGKTRAITHRIAYGIATGVYTPQKVLALTFTARAANEMRNRLRGLGASGVQTRTFHAAALRQLQYFWPQAVGGPLPGLVEHKARLITEAAQNMRLSTDRAAVRDLAAEIEWAKVSMLTPDTYPARAAGRDMPLGYDVRTVQRLYQSYEELKTDRHLIDFEDVLLLTVAVLEEDERVAATVREQYRHFVVDEYQDVSPLQQRLLDRWLGGRDDVCVVGDASQTIYSFTGATSRHLLEFPRRHENARVIELVRDYRSTPQVVETANRLLAARRPAPGSTPGSWATPLRLVAQRPDGPRPSWNEYPDDEAEAAGTAARIRDLLDDGVRAAEIAVLFRTNGQSQAFEAALAEAGIGFQLRGTERFFNRPEVKQAVVQLRTAARAAGAAEDTPRLVRDILSSLGYSDRAPRSTGAVRERWESLASLVSLADRMAQDAAARGEEFGLPALAAELERRVAQQDAPVLEGVTLASLHSAKGLEWDAVFLVGLSEGLMPIGFAETADEVDEERRLLYVGITRAREHLVLSWTLSRTPGGRPNRRPSRFLEALRAPEEAAAGGRRNAVRGGPAPRSGPPRTGPARGGTLRPGAAGARAGQPRSPGRS